MKPIETAKPEVTKFSKEQLVAAGRFAGVRDLLNAILKPKTTYTIKEVEGLIDNYMKGKVK